MAACECRLADHQHAVPCGVSLRLASRGSEGEGAWEAHHIVPESDGGFKQDRQLRHYVLAMSQ